MTKTKKTTLIILAIIVAVMVATGITLKISYDNKVEQDRAIAVQAKLVAEEKAEADRLAKEAEKAEADRLAKEAEKAEADRLVKVAKEQAEAKMQEEAATAAAQATAKAEADKKSKEEAANKPVSSTPTGGNTSSTPKNEITTPGDGTSSGTTGGGWQSYPGNLPNDQKKAQYDLLKDFIGKPEPTGEYRDRQYQLIADEILVKVEWNSKIGMWEALDPLAGWELVCPVNGGTRSYDGFGLEQRR